jgi:predicted secreted protein
MAEQYAAVKAAEEAIYAQLVARNNKSAELSNSYKRHLKRLEDALGMIDQIYLKLRQKEEEQRQKSREYIICPDNFVKYFSDGYNKKCMIAKFNDVIYKDGLGLAHYLQNACIKIEIEI